MHAAGEHDMRGAHAPGRRDDALAHALDVDLQRRRVLEDARSLGFRQFRQTQRIVERVDVKGTRQMQRMEIVIGSQNVPDPLGRP